MALPPCPRNVVVATLQHCSFLYLSRGRKKEKCQKCPGEWAVKASFCLCRNSLSFLLHEIEFGLMTVCIILRGLFRNDRPAITIPNAVVSSFLRRAFMGIEASVVHSFFNERSRDAFSRCVIRRCCDAFVFGIHFPLSISVVASARRRRRPWLLQPVFFFALLSHSAVANIDFPSTNADLFLFLSTLYESRDTQNRRRHFLFHPFFFAGRALPQSFVMHFFFPNKKKSRFFLFLVGEKKKIVLPPSRSRLSGSNERGRSD